MFEVADGEFEFGVEGFFGEIWGCEVEFLAWASVYGEEELDVAHLEHTVGLEVSIAYLHLYGSPTLAFDMQVTLFI